MTTYNTILIETNGVDVPVREASADAAITPGHLCELTATGIKVHATADGGHPALFALEDPFTDPSSTKAVDTAYAQYDRVRYMYAQPGQLIYALLATSNNAALNSPLSSNGDGTFKVITPGASILADAVVAYAAEAYNNTSGSAKRLLVRIA